MLTVKLPTQKRKQLRILFVSRELIAADLAYKLKQEGCNVKLFIETKSERGCFDGLVTKTKNWKSELGWVGKDGLVIFDDVGYGKVQDDLRERGYQVIGGSADGDRLELDRIYGQKIMRQCGIIKNFETRDFPVQAAINFVKKNPGAWVLKQNGHNNALDYVGNTRDGSDVISALENYQRNFGNSDIVTLQRKVEGVEIAIGRFFNGKSWTGPAVINFEHKHLCNDDIGPFGGETGTLMWYEADESNELFKKTLAKLTPHLQKIGHKGYVDINCIVNKKKVYPLEITSRFGSSTIETQCEIQTSRWSEFFMAMAKGVSYDLKYKKGYCINVALTVPPFPYRTSDKNIINSDVNIFLKKELSANDFSHIHFEGIAAKTLGGKISYYTAGTLGYVLYITGMGKSIKEARGKVYNIIQKIIIPKMFYRTDIGLRFVRKDKKLLKNWHWI